MSKYRELYRAEQLPVFQNRMFGSTEEARNCTRGDVVLVQDLETGLIHNRAFRPELMVYDENYQNEQAFSSIFQAHLDRVVEVIQREFAGGSLIEVGCGKGHFLERLERLGLNITGLDPSYQGDNPRILREYFHKGLGCKADGIVLRHVLEHIQNPVAFLSDLCEANDGGKIYLEVPCFDWICRHRAWFDIFYEHVNYFRLSDFQRIFGRVYESGRCFGDQYLYVVADLASVRTPASQEADQVEFPDDFLGTVQACAERLKGPRAANSAVWGGASKGVIFSLFMERAGALPRMVVDINPAKQGKYLAATGLQVQTSEWAMEVLPAGSEIFVMNRNYLPEIKQSTGSKFSYILVEH